MAKRGWLQITALLAALTVALTMVLGSCGKRSGKGSWTLEEAAALFAGDFSSEADITLGELEMTGTLTHEAGTVSLSLLTPEHLEGLCFTAGESGMEVTYKGLSVQAESMPVPGLGKAAAQMITALGNPVLLQPGRTGSGEDTLSGRTENGAFTLTLGEDAPLLLEQPELQLTIRFTDFQALEGGSPLPPESSGEEGGSAGEGSAEQVSSAEEDISSLQQGGE